MNKKAYLILQNGMIFEGRRFGAPGDVTAEVVFTTGMTGYLETLTDPSYHGQIAVQTFPLIGNYGVIPDDFESPRPRLSGYVVRQICDEPSNFRSQGRLDDYLNRAGVVGLSGLDTRALTRVIRETGVMNAAIRSELPADLQTFTAELAAKKLSSDAYAVTCAAPSVLNPEGNPHIVLWDFGFKQGMARAMMRRGCKVTVMPASSTAAQILSLRPDGILLSNGPGDPAEYEDIIAQVNALAETGIPLFGICLGHQLLGIARGGKSVKLKYGHRGANQPVRETATERLFITSQNHGYAIVPESIPAPASMSYVNVNDGTCEGIDYGDIDAFSVQFHPEACSGPLDTSFLFDRFLNNVNERRAHNHAVE